MREKNDAFIIWKTMEESIKAMKSGEKTHFKRLNFPVKA